MRDVRQRHRLLVCGSLLLAALALPLGWLVAQTTPPAPADDVLRLSRNIPGDTKPIQLAADEVFAWTEGAEQHFVLKGQVLIQHGVLRLRAQQAAVFIDMAAYRTKGICRAEVYAEGELALENSGETKQAERAVVELVTRGEVKVHSGRAKLSPQNLSQDPLVGRGRAVRRIAETPRPVAPPATPSPYNPPGIAPPPPPRGTPDPYLPPGGQPGPGATPLPPLQPLPPAGPPGGGPPPGATAGDVQPADFRNTEQPAPAPGRAVSATSPEIVVAQQPVLPPPIDAAGPMLPPPAEPARPPQLPPLSLPEVPERRLAISPRGAAGFGLAREMLPNGEQALVVTGGVILNIRGAPKVDLIDLEADRLVIISKKVDPQQVFDGMRQPEGQNQNPDVELYLAGNVEIRQAATTEARPGSGGRTLFKNETRTIRADEVYYDAKRNVAVALKGSLEIRDPMIASPIIARAEEIVQTSTTTFELLQAEIFSSRLPSDPGLKVYVTQAHVEERKVPRLGLLGQMVDRRTGQPLELTQTWVTAQDVYFELEGVPFFYTPYLAGDARDPLGPVEDVRFGFNNIFGLQLGTTLNMYDLLGVQAYEGTRWTLLTDYLSDRGPGIGTDFDYRGVDPFGIPSRYDGVARGYVIYDDGDDVLGGFRIIDRTAPTTRGRVTWRNGWYEIPYGFQLQSQVAYQSDRNFFEQYYKQEFDVGVPQETFLYLKQQQENAAWTLFANARLREWMTETENLPRVDGHLLGQTFFDLFVYNSQANVGYYRLRPSDDPLPVVPINPVTDVEAEAGRIDWWQEVAVPFHLGPFNLVPYARLDLTGYTEDLNGDTTGRAIGGGGLRAAIPFSRLDADVQSDLFNLNGVFHKMVFSANWYYAQASEPFDTFAQFDRLNVDVDDQNVRQIRAVYPGLLNPGKSALLSSALYDPQIYAIRRQVENRVDTRDDINVVQLGWSNRWQTKRGFPGSQHIVDWMTLDLSASFFPDKDRDNFGSYFAFLEYDWVWNIGDRTALVSNGWADPIEGGARVFNFGGFYNRPDGTSFYLGYRNIDPLESRAVIASATYTFSPKYSGTAAVMYDFGSSKTLNQTLVFNRVGKDLTVSVGVSYNSLQDNFGLIFQIVPNLLPTGYTNLAGLGQPAMPSNGIN